MPKPDAPTDAPVTAEVFTAGRAALQVPLAGLLVSQPSLVDAELLPAEWAAALESFANTKTI